MTTGMRPILLGASLLLVVVSGGCRPQDAVSGMLRGIVTAGPTCPVVREPPDPACDDRPVAGAVLVVLDLDGAEVTRITSAADGRFGVELAAGDYRLVPQPVAGWLGTPAPIQVHVSPGEPLADVAVSYDTGIR